MKRFISIALGLIAAVCAMAQGHVQTRSFVLGDFPDKVTKVVIPQDPFLESAIKQEVVNVWSATSFEFCSRDEYETIPDKENYYFLSVSAFKFKKEAEPGIVFLSLTKGEDHEVISLPLCPADDSSGRELVYLGTLVKTIQDYTLGAMESEKAAYLPETWVNANFQLKGKMMTIYMAKEDLSLSVTQQDQEAYLDEDFFLCSSDQADEIFIGAPINTLVSYTVAPVDPTSASYSYQMLLRADTQELYYLSRHKIGPKQKAGFLPKDLKWLSKRR